MIKTGEAHAEYVPIGHSTSLASRLQALATPGSIAISNTVQKLVEGYFALKALGPVRVKGVSEPIHLYEVTGLGTLRTRLQRLASRGYTKFVGRKHEMETLSRAADLARQGHGQIVAVVAEPGVGKSRLSHEFKAKNQSGWMVLEAVSFSHGKAIPYLPVLELVDSYFGIDPREDSRKRREKVNDKVLALDRKLADELPYLFGLLGLTDGDDPLAGMDARIRRQRTLETLKRVLLRESLNQPLMVVFEDLHWIDGETQAFLNLLADSIGTAKLLLLVTYRPEYSHQWSGKTYYIQLRLDPLGTESASDMFDALLGVDSQTISAPLLALKNLIIEKTEGTPLFMEEIHQALIEEGALIHSGAVKLTRPLNALKIPTTVQAILASRIDRLPAPEKELLQTLAVIGIEFPLALAREVIRKPDDELSRILSNLQLTEFIYEQPALGDIGYTFKHALTQEVAYNSLLSEKRRALHERTANAIEELCPDRLEDHLAKLAYHYGRSANVLEAVEYLGRAGEQARRRSAYADATAHFRHGVELLAHLPEGRERDAREVRLQNRLASSLFATQGYGASEAEQAYIRAKELSERIGDARQLSAALSGLANLYAFWDLRKALEVGQELLRMASSTQEPGALLVGRGAVAHIFYHLGDCRTSLEHANQGLKMFDSHRPMSSFELARLPCLVTGAWALLSLGYPDHSLARCDEALQVARVGGKPLALATALFGAAVAHLLRGNAKAAQEQAETMLTLSKENGFVSYEASALGCRGLALAMQGKGEEGPAECRRGLAIAEGTARVDIAFLEGCLGWGCWLSSKAEEALGAVAKGLASSDQTGNGRMRSGLYLLNGELQLMKKHDESAAEACFKTAIDIARSQQAKWDELAATTRLARLLAKHGNRDEARAMVTGIYNWFTEGFDTANLKEAKALLDELGS